MNGPLLGLLGAGALVAIGGATLLAVGIHLTMHGPREPASEVESEAVRHAIGPGVLLTGVGCLVVAAGLFVLPALKQAGASALDFAPLGLGFAVMFAGSIRMIWRIRRLPPQPGSRLSESDK